MYFTHVVLGSHKHCQKRRFLPECSVFTFIQAGEAAVKAGNLTVGDWEWGNYKRQNQLLDIELLLYFMQSIRK